MVRQKLAASGPDSRLMKPLPKLFPARMWSCVLWSLCLLCFDQARAGQPLPAAEPQSSPQTAVQADVGCRDQGLGISFTEGGARLRCEFQRLEGEATGAGLWLVSTMTDQPDDRFQIKAATVASQELQPAGRVTVADGVVRFLRPGLVEEYTVSMDGVRQDFVVLERPECRVSGLEPVGQGNNVPSRRTALQLGLAVTGARVERSTDGVELVLEKSGRRIAYNRLLVTDAAGTELRARMEVADNSSMSLAVMVDDTDAQYPIRIDPTFSDANWVSMGGIHGANGAVRAVAVDGSGNLYIGGEFTAVGDVVASYVAKWDGNSWSALGSGLSGGFPTAVVTALAVSGDDVYVGGRFAMAGGGAANYIAKWDGSSWSALGGGMDGEVHALAVSGSDLYAGGSFMTAGGNPASRIAKWNGSSWSALGSGIGITEADGSSVSALAVSGTGLYAGGYFTTAGGNPASYIARWNGSDWSALGEGLDNTVSALAVSGGDLYAGGRFAMAGEAPANHIAKWNGSTWSALGEGVDGDVSALAVSGGDLYAGGGFVAAGGSPASRIAKWNGSSWSALESGMESFSVSALAVSGSDLYAGGGFSTAGGTLAMFIAKWNGSNWGALSSEANNGSGVWALAATDGDVYAGGEFTTAGGTPANYIAKWDGSRWSALGSGMNRSVQALAVAGDDLYAGGWFSMADGIPVNHIAK